MKISYDKHADALTIKLKTEKVVRDEAICENLFAGFTREGELAEIQVLDISEIDEV